MKRTLKNILMIALILLMVCAMFFTMNYAKSNSTIAKNKTTYHMHIILHLELKD